MVHARITYGSLFLEKSAFLTDLDRGRHFALAEDYPVRLKIHEFPAQGDTVSQSYP